jgi:hypothetical protein
MVGDLRQRIAMAVRRHKRQRPDGSGEPDGPATGDTSAGPTGRMPGQPLGPSQPPHMRAAIARGFASRSRS